ncbi:HK97 gp10 family phage protein [Phyllobacterium myrsinacearum]|uniref:HK97 gp10 family phage protein n=1 Tax=Phyllobacterium myrsinacearum TaxID=28101 RepID=A0A839EWP2_9HYPH|nr:HK97 gp10 family phage protein [Phyllobacterium myrsinacearum]MBA8881726.1 hypothetical protein [Phyllobacterium myrsinacearum]
MIRMRSTGGSQVVVELRNMGQRVVENARKTMHASAGRIVQEAKLNTPVDTHDLEQSIRIEKSYGTAGRLQIDIVAGGGHIDAYAAEVHENYNPEHAGEGTKEKMRQNPGRLIGEKYLDRAVEDEEGKLNARIIGAISKVTTKL